MHLKHFCNILTFLASNGQKLERKTSKKYLHGPVYVFILNCGKNLIHMVVVSVSDQSSQVLISSLGPNAFFDVILTEIEVSRLILHNAKNNLELQRFPLYSRLPNFPNPSIPIKMISRSFGSLVNVFSTKSSKLPPNVFSAF